MQPTLWYLAIISAATVGLIILAAYTRQLRKGLTDSKANLESFIILKERLSQRELQLSSLEQERSKLSQQLLEREQLNATLMSEAASLRAELQALARHHDEQRLLWSKAELQLSESFKALSYDALRVNNESFLQLARETMAQHHSSVRAEQDLRENGLKQLVDPLKQSLEKVDLKIHQLEKAREGAYQGLFQQIENLMSSQHSLRTETANLANALKSPVTRGRWGEVQLRRVIELAGMLSHCDFFEQKSSEDGSKRPDVLVRLPGMKHIVIDAKVPLASYLEALDLDDLEARRSKFREHAAMVRRHIQQLSQKSYWEQFQPTPEFVVLFLPGENFFSAALEHDPSLIEVGADLRVVIATPTTLIALLRAVHYGWRQEAVQQNAREVSELGKEMYQRLADMTQHLHDMGKSLNQTVNQFNKTVGSFETRVLVSARRFRELKADDPKKNLEGLEELVTEARTPKSLPAETDSRWS